MSRMGIIAIVILISIPAFAGWNPYTVQKGDTLGLLAKRSFPSRSIWGSDGSVAYLFEKNKRRIKNPNFIYVGQEILLPGEELPVIIGRTPSNNNSERRKPATESSESPSAQAPEVSVPTKAVAAPLAPQPKAEDRPATLRAGLLSSLWDRSLSDKTTGASGTARSNAILGISLDSLFPVSENWDLMVGVLYRNIQFANSPNRTVSADATSFIRFRLGASHLGENFNFGGGVQFEQLPLVTGVSSNSVGITSFNVFSPYLSGKWKFHRFGKTSVGLGGLFNYNLGSSNDPYKLQSGWVAELSLPLSRSVSESFSYELEPFVEYGFRETNTVKHTDVNGGVKANLIWQY